MKQLAYLTHSNHSYACIVKVQLLTKSSCFSRTPSTVTCLSRINLSRSPFSSSSASLSVETWLRAPFPRRVILWRLAACVPSYKLQKLVCSIMNVHRVQTRGSLPVRDLSGSFTVFQDSWTKLEFQFQEDGLRSNATVCTTPLSPYGLELFPVPFRNGHRGACLVGTNSGRVLSGAGKPCEAARVPASNDFRSYAPCLEKARVLHS